MRSFADHNPWTLAVCLLAPAGIAMFCMDPMLLALGMAGGVTSFLALCGPGGWRSHLYTLALVLVTALINPLVSHRGATVLFVLNNNPVTLEALCWGAAAAVMIAAVLYWFRAFSSLMTSDRLLYLFGGLSPRLALVLSMALRYVPLFTRQARLVSQSQKALGLYKEDNVIDRFRGGLRVFSVMITWALENGVVTADSMTARGYGVGRRTRYSLFRWTARDAALLALALGLTALAAVGARTVSWYPVIALEPVDALGAAGYGAYALLAFLPAIIQAKEAIRWHCLKSGI